MSDLQTCVHSLRHRGAERAVLVQLPQLQNFGAAPDRLVLRSGTAEHLFSKGGPKLRTRSLLLEEGRVEVRVQAEEKHVCPGPTLSPPSGGSRPSCGS